MNRFITNNPEFPADVRQMLKQHASVRVSGQPSHIYTPEGKAFFFSNCELVVDMPLFVTTALMRCIEKVTHPDVPEQFTGNKAIIFGFDMDTGYEYQFPIMDGLLLVPVHDNE